MPANVKLIIAFFLVVSITAMAQKQPTDSLTNIRLPRAGAIFNWQTNATALTNDFLLEVNSGTLSEASKLNSQKKLAPLNYFVNQIEGGLYYVHPLKNRNDAGIIFEASAGSDMSASFTKDAFELLLFGNARYKNQTKNTGKFNYRNLVYQKFGAGMRKYSKSNTQCISATMDLVVGNYANLFSVTKGSVFTEENGEYLDVDAAFQQRYTDGGSFANPKGLGVAFNASWIKKIPAKKAMLQINIKDLGLVHFKSTSQYRYQDTALRFEGFNYGSLNSKTLIHDFNLTDSVTEIFKIKNKNESFNYLLSALVEVNYEKELNSKSSLLLQANAYLYNALPLFKASYAYNLNRNWSLIAGARAGGFAKLDFDLSARYCSSNYYFNAMVRSVEGLISPGHFSGMGAFLHFGLFLPQKTN